MFNFCTSNSIRETPKGLGPVSGEPQRIKEKKNRRRCSLVHGKNVKRKNRRKRKSERTREISDVDDSVSEKKKKTRLVLEAQTFT